MDSKTNLINSWKEHFRFKENELNAFNEIKREDFILKELEGSAYEDTPLPVLRGKTISQPTTVMIMTSALELKKGDKVFEIGTGSGYQTALISKIIGQTGTIISTEVIPELIEFAKNNLRKANINNVEIFEDDGSKGYQELSPFDKIIITAACKDFPTQLLEQLNPYGIIVGPVGTKDEQRMIKGIKQKDGRLELEFLGPFLFSPMYGKYGFEI